MDLWILTERRTKQARYKQGQRYIIPRGTEGKNPAQKVGALRTESLPSRLPAGSFNPITCARGFRTTTFTASERSAINCYSRRDSSLEFNETFFKKTKEMLTGCLRAGTGS